MRVKLQGRGYSTLGSGWRFVVGAARPESCAIMLFMYVVGSLAMFR